MTVRALLPVTIASLIALSILIGLGLWQLERREWKHALIEKIEEHLSGPPVAMPEAVERLRRGRDVDFLRVEASGRLLPGLDRYVWTVHGGQAGWRVVTPLELEDGRVLLVDRGFVPQDVEADAPPRGDVTVTGIVRRRDQRKGWFEPENLPRQNAWYWWDMPALAASLAPEVAAERVLPFVLQETPDHARAGWPRPLPARPELSDRHLEYAVTWFGLVACLVAVYVVFVRQRLTGRGQGKA